VRVTHLLEPPSSFKSAGIVERALAAVGSK